MQDKIVIRGAREHNLKNVDLTIPRNKLVVLTGLSGSGKSSLAFDTLYAEGQRRYVESLSSYARQFLGQMDKPDVDSIDGLSPAISIDQKTTSHNPRSTVGTVTEIYDYLRLLYARIGVAHCPECGREIKQQTVDQMVDQIMKLPADTRTLVLAPVVRARKGEHRAVFEDARKNGYVRVRIDGQVVDLSEEIALEKNKKHSVEIVVDRIIIREGAGKRLADSLETALALSGGIALVGLPGGEDMLVSQNYACPDCGISIEELAPRMFSFNSPFGACPTCLGLGSLMKIDPDLIIPDRSLSLRGGAIKAPGWQSSDDEGSVGMMYLRGLSEHYGFSLDAPVSELSDEVLNILFYGTGTTKVKVSYEKEYGSGSYATPFEGIITSLERRYQQTTSEGMKEMYESMMGYSLCPDCGGARLKPASRAVTVGGLPIHKLCAMDVWASRAFLGSLDLSEKERIIAHQVLKETDSRLGFLVDVGLGYLTLSRSAGTLSGGEAQRIRLATQIGSSLTGVLYILDEPSIGLHQRDNARLLSTLKRLRDLGNSVIVVEHDEETMFAADYIVDIGPGAGEHGGEVVAAGTVNEIMNNPASLTGAYLTGRERIEVPEFRRTIDSKQMLTVRGARANNLKGIDASFPLGVLTCVTGVSGSGKSSLVNEILSKALSRDLNRARIKPGPHDGIDGISMLDKVINIDQSPIGRTPRSNPATYTGVFDLIRELFTATPDARMRGYKSGRFSFNVKGGRCEACRGDGILKIEMHFLPDVYVPCEVCKGKRYNRETLEVRYKGKSIYDVLNMRVDEAVEFFAPLPRIARIINTLKDVGLGYIKLGQPSTQLSGGEAQRVKLATELARRDTGRTLYILDEPTTGLHMADVKRLVEILQRLCEGGNTVVVIEHNLDVIKTADYIIDLGPEGGDRGGMIVAAGTPEQVSRCAQSFTGEYLQRALRRAGEERRNAAV